MHHMLASSRLQTLLNAGQFVVSAEITPPRHYNLSPLIARAQRIASYVDVVQLNDNVLSQARLSNIVVAHFIRQIGIEPVVQLTLRHKNRIALQSDLLGLAALGIRNLILVGGYPCSIGTDPEAKDATDISAVEALAAIHNLTTYGKMFNGDIITPPPDFHLGAIAFPTTHTTALKDTSSANDFWQKKNVSLDESMACLEAKIASGAKYIQLQAAFEPESISQWMKEVRSRELHKRVHFIAAIFPFSNTKELEFLQKIPGLNVPEQIVKRIHSSSSRSSGLQVTLELIEAIRNIEGIRGIHMRSVRTGDCIPFIVESAGLRQSVENRRQETEDRMLV